MKVGDIVIKVDLNDFNEVRIVAIADDGRVIFVPSTYHENIDLKNVLYWPDGSGWTLYPEKYLISVEEAVARCLCR
jgi:hypothetical protein